MKIDIVVNDAFKEYIANWEYKDYVVFGGYGSSKSYNTALKLVLKALQEKRRILVVRAVARTLQDSCYSLIKEIIENNNLSKLFKFSKSPLRITCNINGSEFLFLGLDDPAKLKSINAIDTVWIEEAAEISFDAFKELKGRLRALKRVYMLLTFNPVSKSNWVYKYYFKTRQIDVERLYQDKLVIYQDTYYHHSVVTDNKFVNKDYIKTLDDLKNHDEELYRVARQGRFGVVGERVFKNVHKMEHDQIAGVVKYLTTNNLLNVYTGLDLGFSFSYNALIRCVVDRDNNDLYIYQEMYNKGLINQELREKVKQELKDNKYRVLKVDSARPEMVAELRMFGIRADSCKKGKNKELEDLQKIRSFNHVFVSSNCIHMYEDMINLSHLKDKKSGEYLEDKFNIDAHTVDALRYALEDYKSKELKNFKIIV